MKYLILIICLFIGMAACHDSDDNTTPGQEETKNTSRVKEINGKNSYWGEYHMQFIYYGDKVDSAWIWNAGKDTIALLTTSEDDKALTYYISDFIPAIDPDSIQKLEDRYGPLAKDSIPMMTRTLYSVKNQFTNGILMAQEFAYYRPREDVGTGVDFNNKYLNDKRIRYIYEYNAAGTLKICRVFRDVYEKDPDDNAEFQRVIYKAEFSYDDAGHVTTIAWYEGDDRYETTASYRLADTYQLVYSGDLPTSLNGEHLQLQYQGTGKLISSIMKDGSSVKYSYTGEGYLNRIEEENGEYIEVKYEAGNGNFGLFTPLLDKGFYVPFIK